MSLSASDLEYWSFGSKKIWRICTHETGEWLGLENSFRNLPHFVSGETTYQTEGSSIPLSTETVNVVISLLSTLTLFPKWDWIKGEQTISTYHGIEKQDFERNRHESLNETSRKRCLKTPGSRGRLHSESDGAHWMCLWVRLKPVQK